MPSPTLNSEQQHARRFLVVNRVYLLYSLIVSSLVLMYVFAVFMGQDVSPDPSGVKRVFGWAEKAHCLGCVITVTAYYTLWFHDPRIWKSPDYDRRASARYWRYHLLVHGATLALYFIEPYGLVTTQLFQTLPGIVLFLAMMLPVVPFLLALRGLQMNR